ncbi:MAG: RNA-guided pseudouridylation complex pseudouridine synthase subunit Cbf5 [Nanoarchaeota archaeon]|nr:RNA-guided pseudouridylation complex pseudouridine synthase subunit Cbf5 [Nanoarchaeota archaeon]
MKEKSIKELLEFSLINIDKPAGPTSFKVGQSIKNELGLKKTGHLGTLDPMVTGVLPIALNRACRLNEYFMHRDKEYVGIMRLHEEVSLEVLKKEVKGFIGKITQLPPVRSSIKRVKRVREIKSFKILEKDEKDVLFVADVQAGTYIRKLIHDLGEKIGGAHMLELRRIKAGLFDESTIVNLYDFEEAVKDYKTGKEEKLRKILIPAEEALIKLIPKVEVKKESLKALLNGKPLMLSDLKKQQKDLEKRFAVFCGDRFVAVMRGVSEKDIIGKAEFVFN